MHQVVPLHDQLQDVRVWEGLAHALGGGIETHIVSVPPLDELGPAAWAAHIGRYAQQAIANDIHCAGADLVLAVGAAAAAATGLVRRREARSAILINPDPEELAREPTQEFDDPHLVDERLTEFFDAMEPHAAEFFNAAERHTGDTTPVVLSQDAIEALANASLAMVGDLEQTQRDVLREAAVEQLSAAKSLQVRRRTPDDGPGWLAQITQVQDHCLVALSDLPAFQGQLARVLHERAPRLPVIWIPGAGVPWMQAPSAIATVVKDFLQRASEAP